MNKFFKIYFDRIIYRFDTNENGDHIIIFNKTFNNSL